VSMEEQVTRQNVNVPEDDRMLPRAADTEISFGFQLRARPLHPRIGCGDGLNVELEVSQEGRTCGWAGNPFLGGDERSGNFQALRERHPLHGHAPGKYAALGSTGQPKGASGQPAHAFRVADAGAVTTRGDVVT